VILKKKDKGIIKGAVSWDRFKDINGEI